jgi:AAA+ superfamily predicted ATPase
VAVILDHIDLVIPAMGGGATPSLEQSVVLEALQRCAIDPIFDSRRHALVLIARTGEIHRSILEAAGFRAVRAPAPDSQDLEAAAQMLEERAFQDPTRFARLGGDVTTQAVAREGRGLRIDDLLRASREAAAAGAPVDSVDLRKRKSASIERQAGRTLRLHAEGRTLDDVAGLPHVRRFVDERMRSGHWPPIILLAGPPGVGKTFVVRAIAAALRWPAVSFHLVRSPWVGETEINTARALATIDELKPVVVHIDEVDQAQGQRSTGGSADGGTSERFQASLWEFTGEGTRPGVLFCLTTNRTDLLDSADRSRAQVIPIIHPTPREVAQLLPALASQLGRDLDRDLDLDVVAAHAKLQLTSARHLLRILERAATLADIANGDHATAIGMQQIEDAIDDYMPHTDELEEELMGLGALSRTSFRSLLPWIAAEEAGLPREVPAYVAPLLDDNGDLNPQRLRERIDQLADTLAMRKARKQW